MSNDKAVMRGSHITKEIMSRNFTQNSEFVLRVATDLQRC